MAQITVKYDPTLELEPIEEMMYATNKEESPEDSVGEVQQTKVTGIVAPLIKVNKIEILWAQIERFTLDSTGFLPKLSFTFDDCYGFVKSLDQPKNDNLVRIQILPPFDNAYKKVNLRFFITSIRIRGTRVTISAEYNVSKLYQYQIKSLGPQTTYGMVDAVAKDCALGLAANVDETNDERYVYCANQNYIEMIGKELRHSGNEQMILDSWVDWHNYLILCDIMERYKAIDKDLKVWIAPSRIPDVETDKEIHPNEVPAILTNSPAAASSPLYIRDYVVLNDGGSNIDFGTDKVLEYYVMDNGESTNVLIQDGDIKKDTFIRTIYMGEQFGDYDYGLKAACRAAFLQKVKGTCIGVELSQPVLGLERGQKVEIKYYDINEMVKTVKDQNPIETNVPDETGEPDDKEGLSLNKQVSGQYLIIGTTLKFEGVNNGWKYNLLLTRPTDLIKSYVEDE